MKYKSTLGKKERKCPVSNLPMYVCVLLNTYLFDVKFNQCSSMIFRDKQKKINRKRKLSISI